MSSISIESLSPELKEKAINTLKFQLRNSVGRNPLSDYNNNYLTLSDISNLTLL